MAREEGKTLPVEKQREMLINANAIKFTELYLALTEAYGEAEGAKMYEEIYETKFKKGSQGPKRDLDDIIKAELSIFPVLGWKLWAEKKIENGEEIWYEHLEHCPYLTVTRKRNLPDPCPILCDYDSKFGEKYGLGKWKRVKHIPSGDSECSFKITKIK
ncbi:MAG: L-2-amino-thiazoline-4-carboxylic acid hydrolase [Candidatus Schekmanbacteria bacterium]|nr:L-2-amino-thiazoline-4-carboxylic acid hydrolase [Candidatus Schekmanbacteria bacterium]